MDEKEMYQREQRENIKSTVFTAYCPNCLDFKSFRRVDNVLVYCTGCAGVFVYQPLQEIQTKLKIKRDIWQAHHKEEDKNQD